MCGRQEPALRLTGGVASVYRTSTTVRTSSVPRNKRTSEGVVPSADLTVTKRRIGGVSGARLLPGEPKLGPPLPF